MADGIEKGDLNLAENPTFTNISKLAIENTDGIIIGSKEINTEVENFIQTLDKPVLDYQGDEEYVDAYNDFYDKLLH